MTGAPPFEIGVGAGTTDYDALRHWGTLADRGGIAFLSIGDNPGALKETYVTLATLASHVTNTRVGTGMTNPLHRDPLVVASAISSVEALAPGRTFLGISTGRARERATVDQLRRHLTAVRELWYEGATDFDGRRLRMTWDARPVPVLVGASGPRALRLAGEMGDGAIIEAGLTSEAVEWALGHIAAGARAAGRDVGDLELWWYAKASVGDTTEQALDDAAAGLAASAALVLGRDPEGMGVPSSLCDGYRSLYERYDMDSHVAASGDDPNRALLGDPALLAYALDRYGCVGTVDDWIDRIGVLRDRGVQRLFCAAVVPDRGAFVQGIAEEVLPRLRERACAAEDQ